MSLATTLDTAVGHDEIGGRIAELREELAKGRRRAAALDAERAELHDTLLRIGGAVQVLEELLRGHGDEHDE